MVIVSLELFEVAESERWRTVAPTLDLSYPSYPTYLSCNEEPDR